MPLVAVVAAVGLEVQPVQGPGRLGGLLGFALGAIGHFGAAVFFEMRGHPRQWTRGDGATLATFHGVFSVVTRGTLTEW